MAVNSRLLLKAGIHGSEFLKRIDLRLARFPTFANRYGCDYSPGNDDFLRCVSKIKDGL